METPGRIRCGPGQKLLVLRFLIPILILATFIADIGLRFVPPGRVYFHAWEAATLHATAVGSFTPNFHYENNHASGDLANMGNLPRFRHYHKEVFTTDRFGFRNPPSEGADEVPSAILVGDSFSVGGGNSDGDTLSAQLTSRLSNGRVYNGANTGPHWIMVNELISRLHMRGGLVIWQMSERQKLPASLQAEGPYTLPSASSTVGDRRSIVQRFSDWSDGLLAYSPLRIFLTGAYRKLENGVLFPNPSENLVMVGHLRNGDTMLFLKTEVDNFYQPKYDSPTYLTEITLSSIAPAMTCWSSWCLTNSASTIRCSRTIYHHRPTVNPIWINLKRTCVVRAFPLSILWVP
jgi:hypothetical protein